jgi:hypothetical protein
VYLVPNFGHLFPFRWRLSVAEALQRTLKKKTSLMKMREKQRQEIGPGR